MSTEKKEHRETIGLVCLASFVGALVSLARADLILMAVFGVIFALAITRAAKCGIVLSH